MIRSLPLTFTKRQVIDEVQTTNTRNAENSMLPQGNGAQC